MIRLEREKMQNAISRAKVIHPKVRMIGERTYAVTGSTGSTYTVRFAVATGQPGAARQFTRDRGSRGAGSRVSRRQWRHPQAAEERAGALHHHAGRPRHLRRGRWADYRTRHSLRLPQRH